MKTRNIILIVAGAFVGLNVLLGWIAFFVYQTTPDTLLTLCLSVGGVEGVLTAVIAIADKKNKSEQTEIGEIEQEYE